MIFAQKAIGILLSVVYLFFSLGIKVYQHHCSKSGNTFYAIMYHDQSEHHHCCEEGMSCTIDMYHEKEFSSSSITSKTCCSDKTATFQIVDFTSNSSLKKDLSKKLVKTIDFRFIRILSGLIDDRFDISALGYFFQDVVDKLTKKVISPVFTGNFRL